MVVPLNLSRIMIEYQDIDLLPLILSVRLIHVSF